MGTLSPAAQDALFATIIQDMHDLNRWLKVKGMFYKRPRWTLQSWDSKPGGRFWLKKLLIKHKDRYTRYQLTRFLWYNNIPLAMASKWVLFGSHYDPGAVRDQQTMGKTPFQSGRLWNISEGEVVEFRGRQFVHRYF